MWGLGCMGAYMSVYFWKYTSLITILCWRCKVVGVLGCMCELLGSIVSDVLIS